MTMLPFTKHVDQYYAYWYQYLVEVEDEINDAESKVLDFKIQGLKQDSDLANALFGTVVSFLPAGKALTVVLTIIKDVQPTLAASKSIVQKWAGNPPSKGKAKKNRQFTSTGDFFDEVEARVTATRAFVKKEWAFMKDTFVPEVYWGNQDCRKRKYPLGVAFPPNKNSKQRIWSVIKQAVPNPPGGPFLSKTTAEAAAIIQAGNDNIDWKLAEVCMIKWARANKVYLHNGGMFTSWDSLRGTTSAQDDFILKNKAKLMSRPQNKRDIQYKWGLRWDKTIGDGTQTQARQTADIPVDRWP